jgi:hypothetical protein
MDGRKVGEISIFPFPAEAGFEVMCVDPLTGDNGGNGIADGMAVLDNALSCSDGTKGKFVPFGDRIVYGYGKFSNHFSRDKITAGDSCVIPGI